jgi:aarF domain-containing kinase
MIRIALLGLAVGWTRGFTSLLVSVPELRQPSRRRTANNAVLPANDEDDADTTWTAFFRAKEIGSMVLEGVLVPALLSLATERTWDAFWNATATSSDTISNAERVALTLEAMGPTYVKFGQALATRQDFVPRPLAHALSRLQDDMAPFDTELARRMIRNELAESSSLSAEDLDTLMQSLSEEPVAAASIGQVYRGHLPGRGTVALKVQRPNIRGIVERDATLLRKLASWVESLPGLPPASLQQKKLVATKLVDSVDEFMSRVFEELDYRNEARNMELFARLYSYRNGTFTDVRVVVPEVYLDLCTDHLIVMEWIEGSKLEGLSKDGADGESELAENLAMVETGIAATLSQLLGTGIMHADPHAGNLLKVETEEGLMLGFLDFGMLSTVPESVRDALVCAVVQVVFTRDTQAVADLFGELQLLPPHVVQNPKERDALTSALDRVFQDVLQYPTVENVPAGATTATATTAIPILRFDKLLGGLTLLVTRFQFSLPPYFVNIARALATLEGVARKLDPSFNALQSVYPYALNRILSNPSRSTVVEDTLLGLLRNRESGRFDRVLIEKLITDSVALSGSTRREVLLEVLSSRFGKRIARKVVSELLLDRVQSRPRRNTAGSRETSRKLFQL